MKTTTTTLCYLCLHIYSHSNHKSLNPESERLTTRPHKWSTKQNFGWSLTPTTANITWWRHIHIDTTASLFIVPFLAHQVLVTRAQLDTWQHNMVPSLASILNLYEEQMKDLSNMQKWSFECNFWRSWITTGSVICTSADIQLYSLSDPNEPLCELYSYWALFHIITRCVRAMKYCVNKLQLIPNCDLYLIQRNNCVNHTCSRHSTMSQVHHAMARKYSVTWTTADTRF
jgi:hypothetical protein